MAGMDNLWGDQLFQERARSAFPLLVRQALATTPVTYEDLAQELDMPNPRNLNYVLGCVGRSLQILEQQWGEKIPPLQSLVINKSTRIPGEGIDWFIDDLRNYRNQSRQQREQIINGKLQAVYAYPRWNEVLSALDLQPIPPTNSTVLAEASRRGGVEGEEHKRLKAFVARHPELLNLRGVISVTEIEHRLPSGDSVDVFFAKGKEVIGVEVKPSTADEADIVRGFYQCIKYKAVLQARQCAQLKPQNARTFLVLGGVLPQALIALKNTLGISVVENVQID
ncbi:hypothetical protein ACOI9X_02050 [Pseudomonas sp. P2757]|uniref:hypothetical protein n=1 Tax=unclassified Pseudomonas TaxID=196821 RepID=UPI003B59D07D